MGNKDPENATKKSHNKTPINNTAVSQPNQNSSIHFDEDSVVICEWCRQAKGGMWVAQCDGCTRWYHCDCVKFKLDEASEKDPWYCPECRSIQFEPSQSNEIKFDNSQAEQIHQLNSAKSKSHSFVSSRRTKFNQNKTRLELQRLQAELDLQTKLDEEKIALKMEALKLKEDREKQLLEERFKAMNEEIIHREARDTEYLYNERIIEENVKNNYASVNHFGTKGNFGDDFNNTPNKTLAVEHTFETHSLGKNPVVVKPGVYHPPQHVDKSKCPSGDLKSRKLINTVFKSKMKTSNNNNNQTFGFIRKSKNLSINSIKLLIPPEPRNGQSKAQSGPTNLMDVSNINVISRTNCENKSGMGNQLRTSQSHCWNDSGSSINKMASQPTQTKLPLSTLNINSQSQECFKGGAPPWMSQKWATIRNKRIMDRNCVKTSKSSSTSASNIKQEFGAKSYVKKSSSLYKYSPYLDEEGLLRTRGRIGNISGVKFETKRLMIMPSNHKITEWVDKNYHWMHLHRNNETVINDVKPDKIQSTYTNWNLKPPPNSHLGGLWEGLIGVIKGNSKLVMFSETTEKLFRSYSLGLVNRKNSRPLTYVPPDSREDVALMPNQSTFESSNEHMAPGDYLFVNKVLTRGWHTYRELTNMFWSRWMKDFIPTLTCRSKWFPKAQPIKIGDIVLLVDENNARNSYPKGVVLGVLPDKHGQIRRATIKISEVIPDVAGRTKDAHVRYSIKTRPIAKLAVLDIAGKDNEVRPVGAPITKCPNGEENVTDENNVTDKTNTATNPAIRENEEYVKNDNRKLRRSKRISDQKK